MRSVFFLLTFILILPAVSASSFFTAEEISAQSTIQAQANLSLSSESTLDYLAATLNFYAREDTYQKILSMSSGEGSLSEDVIEYRWEELSPSYNLLATSTTRTRYQYPKITQKHPFPLEYVPEDAAPFTRPTEFIDSDNPQIIKKAVSIVQGEDDAYAAVFAIGAWVNGNIDYSLNTLTAEVSQKSSWVLENEFGVCDEITSLFIALNRAVGIPARFVSGMSYTNFNNINDYGPHAWAEVYIGDQWVPFDITYGEYGYVDAGHIKMSVSDDAQTPSIEYSWKGHDIELVTAPISIEVEPTEVGNSIEDKVQLSASFLRSRVGFGSYNVLEVVATNPHPYYVATELYTSKSPDMTFLDDHIPILLKPEETRRYTFRVKIHDDTLDPDFVYTFPVLAYTTQNISTQASFEATKESAVYDLNEVNELAAFTQTEETQSNLLLTCTSDAKEYNKGEQISVECTLVNEGNEQLSNIDLCSTKECIPFTLDAKESIVHTFTFKEQTHGQKDRFFQALHTDALAIHSVTYTILDKAGIAIVNLRTPATTTFEESFDLTFTLDKTSIISPEDIMLTVSIAEEDQTWDVGTLEADREITLSIPSRSLREGNNTIILSVLHADGEIEESVSISLVNVTYWQKFLLFLEHLF